MTSIQLVHFALCDDPSHIQVVGASGVGKTALIRRSIQLLIDSGALDNLVWLDKPRTVDEIHQRLAQFQQNHGQEPIHEVIQYQRTAFVFDGVELLCCEADRLQRLVDMLSSGGCFFVQPLPTPLAKHHSVCAFAWTT